jgi:hypothetical protein
MKRHLHRWKEFWRLRHWECLSSAPTKLILFGVNQVIHQMGHFDPAVECAADRPGGGDTHWSDPTPRDGRSISVRNHLLFDGLDLLPLIRRCDLTKNKQPSVDHHTDAQQHRAGSPRTLRPVQLSLWMPRPRSEACGVSRSPLQPGDGLFRCHGLAAVFGVWRLTFIARLTATVSARVANWPRGSPGGGGKSHEREAPPRQAVASAQRPDGWV